MSSAVLCVELTIMAHVCLICLVLSLSVSHCDCLSQVPLQLIESVECRDMFQLHITCKDCKVIRWDFTHTEIFRIWLSVSCTLCYFHSCFFTRLFSLCHVFDRCQFSTFEQGQEWMKRLSAAVRPPAHIEDLFSFAFHAWCVEKEQHGDLCKPGASSALCSLSLRCSLFFGAGTSWSS